MATIVLDALHADQVLDRAGDAEREVQLRRDGLAGAADLALHRQPAGVADRPRRGELGAERLGELLRERQMFSCSLMPRPTDDDPLGLRQIDRLLAPPETAPPASGGSPAASTVTASARTGAGDAPRAAWSARNAPIWNVTKCGAGPCGTTSAVSLPWNIGRTNAGRAAGVLTPVTSVMSARSSRAASFGAKSRV